MLSFFGRRPSGMDTSDVAAALQHTGGLASMEQCEGVSEIYKPFSWLTLWIAYVVAYLIAMHW